MTGRPEYRFQCGAAGDRWRPGRLGWAAALLVALAACAPASAPAQPAASGAPPAQPTAAAAPATSAPAAVTRANPTPVLLHQPSESLAQLTTSIAIEQGFFLQEGLDVTKRQMPTNTALAAMLSGEVDYTETIGSVSRAIVAQQAPFRIVAVASEGITFSLVGNADVRTLADLRGKPLGTYAPRDTSTIGAAAVLRRHGMDLQRDEITVAPLGSDAALFAGLASGAVAAIVTTPPFNFKAEKELGARPLANVHDYLQVAFTGLSTTTQRLAEQPQQVRAMVRAMLRAADYIHGNPAAVSRYVARQYEVDDDVARRSLDQIVPLLSRNGSAPREALQGLIDLAREQAEVTDAVDLAQVYDFRPLEDVQRELGRR